MIFKLLPWQPFTKEYEYFSNGRYIEKLIFRYIMNSMWRIKDYIKQYLYRKKYLNR